MGDIVVGAVHQGKIPVVQLFFFVGEDFGRAIARVPSRHPVPDGCQKRGVCAAESAKLVQRERRGCQQERIARAVYCRIRVEEPSLAGIPVRCLS